KGSALKDLQAIRPIRQIEGITVVRPLLNFSKEELKHYANLHQLVYFEDQSNQELRYQRNRLRKQVVPLLKEENPALLTQLQTLIQEIHDAEEVIQDHVATVYDQIFSTDSPETWRIDIP